MTAPAGGVRHLDVRSGCAVVVADATHVRIDDDAVEALAQRMIDEPAAADSSAWRWPHLNAADVAAEQAAAWTLLLDAMNFSFWDEEDARWRVAGHDGYMALVHALRRGYDRDPAIATPRRWVGWTVADLAAVLRGDAGGAAAPPLLVDRHAGGVELGRWLLERHRGSALAAVREAGDAYGFAVMLATELPRFRDVAEHGGRRVALLKRAQIAAFDCGLALGDQAPPGLGDTSGLTAFADYKLPQLLRHHGCLEYSPRLAATIDARTALGAASEEEVEIRAATVIAVDRLVDSLRRHGHACDAASVDSRLWWRSQGEVMRPYHRVRSIWY